MYSIFYGQVLDILLQHPLAAEEEEGEVLLLALHELVVERKEDLLDHCLTELGQVFQEKVALQMKQKPKNAKSNNGGGKLKLRVS